jgi:hypothetical protein
MSDARWAYYRPRAWAVIDGVETDVAAVQVDYGLNTVPQCRIDLPTGRSGATGAPAAIHQIAANLTEQTPIQVYARMNPRAGSGADVRGLGLPTGDFLLFEGLTSGGGHSRGTQASRYSISANGWPVRLNQASAFSDSSHPGNPARYSYGALMPDGSDTGGLDWTVLTRATTFVTPGNLASDVWGQALYPWLHALTEKDGFWVVEQNAKGEKTNKQAQETLQRLKPGGRWYQALKPAGTLSIDVDVAAAIARDIARSTHDPGFAANQTLWDILVGTFAADYLFAVVVRPADGLVIPYIPGRRGHPYETIRTDEHDHAENQLLMPRPLRAFGILSGLATRSGASGFDDDVASFGVGGWYDVAKDGAVMIGQAPRWMSAVMSPARWSAKSTGADLTAIATAAHPDAGAANASREEAKGRAKGTIKSLLDAYAQARFAQQVLQGRYIVVSGAFRVDVAPGSLVQVEGIGERFAPGDALALAHYGEVLRVSLAIDAETPRIGTALHIGNARTAVEQDDDRTSVPGHPLYADTWSGCPLIDP